LKGFWHPTANSMLFEGKLFGATGGVSRNATAARVQPTKLARVTSGQAGDPNGEVAMDAAGEATPIALSLGVGDPFGETWRRRGRRYISARTSVRNRRWSDRSDGRWGESQPARELVNRSGSYDNSLVAEIGTRRLLPGDMRYASAQAEAAS